MALPVAAAISLLQVHSRAMTYHVLFAAPLFMGTILRIIRGAAHLPRVDLTIVMEDALGKLSRDVLDRVAGHRQVRDARNPAENVKLIRVELV